ncbi:MAG: hypothetical protein DMF90_28745 [Acidobacteria bacterium]|nr:MAG: hypothetical protein DMF90_28745 [Acidobacteriota bacterium]
MKETKVRGPLKPATAAKPARRRVSAPWWLACIVAVVAVSALGYWGIARSRQAAYLARLPQLPELSNQPSAIRAHLADADRAARAAPMSSTAVGALGLAYHADLFYDQAARCYAIAETLDRSEWRWTYYRALALDGRGDMQGLVAGFRVVVRAAPDFSPASWRLADAEFKAGRYEVAGETWRRVMSLPEPARPTASDGTPARAITAPVSAYAALGLARVALAQSDADKARSILEEITATRPRFGPAFRLLGTAYSELNRSEDASRAIRTADRLPAYDPYFDPTIETLVRESRSSTFLLQQAAVADLSTNAPWREYLVRRALGFDPENTDALYELASILRTLRRYDEALELLERHRRLVPGDLLALADIGRCLSGLGRLPEAEAVLRRALDGHDDASTRYDLGFVLDRAGRSGEAVVQYQLALRLNPHHKDALNNLGVDLARSGRMPDAARTFDRLTAIDPDNAEAHTNLGAVLLAQGARERAAQEFRAALEISPDHARARDGLRQLER